MDKPMEREEFVPPDGGYGWVIVFANILINVSLKSKYTLRILKEILVVLLRFFFFFSRLY